MTCGNEYNYIIVLLIIFWMVWSILMILVGRWCKIIESTDNKNKEKIR